jgi:hypothetical protein
MLDVLKIPPSELFALLAAIGFAAGLNLYATVAALGLLAHFGHLPLPPGLQLLDTWPVIAASLVLFGIEFFADKIPAFDLIWNALHTFIRVPVAGLLAYQATSQLSPEKQLLATLLGAAASLCCRDDRCGVCCDRRRSDAVGDSGAAGVVSRSGTGAGRIDMANKCRQTSKVLSF